MPFRKMVERAEKVRKHLSALRDLARHDAYIYRLTEKLEIYDKFRVMKGRFCERFLDLAVEYGLSESRIEKIVREMARKENV